MPKALNVTQSPAFIDDLGTDDDPVVAKRYGVATGTVKYQRDQRGIPSWRSVRRKRVKRLIKKGALNDLQIQTITGMDRRAVARLRVKMGSVSPYVTQAEANAEKLLAYLDDHPQASIRAVAQAVNLSPSGAYRILKALDTPHGDSQ